MKRELTNRFLEVLNEYHSLGNKERNKGMNVRHILGISGGKDSTKTEE